MKISEKFRTAIKSEETKMLLALEIGIAYGSLQRWLIYDNEKLATLRNIAAITKVTGLVEGDIFEKEMQD